MTAPKGAVFFGDWHFCAASVCPGVLGFAPSGELLWQTPQSNQRSCPDIRPGFAGIPLAGTILGARREGPSLAHRGSGGIHAAKPQKWCQRGASCKGRLRARDFGYSFAGFRIFSNPKLRGEETALCSGFCSVSSGFPEKSPHAPECPFQEAEGDRSFRGRAAWMPRKPRLAMDGPSRRAPETPRNRGYFSRSEKPDVGARPFGSFWGVCQKGLARGGETKYLSARRSGAHVPNEKQ